MFAKIKDNQVIEYPIIDIHQVFPNISFPLIIRQEDLPEGYVIVEEIQPPSYAPDTHELVRTDIYQDGNKWVIGYTVELLSADKLQERSIVKAAEIRNIRSKRLFESDWTQVADAPVDKAAWAVYRQALRDISSQEGFPWTVEWPAQP